MLISLFDVCLTPEVNIRKDSILKKIWDKTSNKAGIYGIIKKKPHVNTDQVVLFESNEFHFQYYLTLPSLKIVSIVSLYSLPLKNIHILS